MKKFSIWLFLAALFSTPLLFHYAILHEDQMKWYGIAVLIPFAFLLGPAARALRGEGLCFPEPRLPLLLLFALAAASLLWAESKALGLRSLATFVAGLGIASTAAFAFQYRQERGRSGLFLLAPLFSAGAIAALLGVFSSPVSSFGNTNHGSEFFVPLAVTAFVLAAVQKREWHRLHYLLFAMLFAAYVSSAWVRAGMISCAAGAIVASLLLWRSLAPGERRRIIGPTAALLIGFLLPHFMQTVDSPPRDATRSINTVLVRQKIYASTLRMIAQSPILGFGEGNFQVAFPPFRDPEEIWISSHQRKSPGEPFVDEPHNDYLLIGAELGGLGLVLAGWFFFGAFRRWKEGSQSVAGIIALSSLAAIAVNALFRSPLTNPSSALVFWTLLGIWSAESSPPSRIPASLGKIVALLAAPLFLGLFYLGACGALGELHLARYFAREGRDMGELQKAAEQDPFDPQKWERLGAALNLRGEKESAREAFAEALRLNSNLFSPRLVLGLLELDRGEIGLAEEHLRHAERLDRANPRLDRAFALLAARKGDDEEARRRLRAEIKHGGSLQAFREVGRFLEEVELEKKRQGRDGDQGRALRYYAEHVALQPEDADTWLAMGQIFRNQGDSEEAKRLFAKARRLFGIEYLRQRRAKEAEKQFAFYREFAAPEDPLPELYRAAAALAQGDHVRAEDLIREAGVRGARRETLKQPGLEALAADSSLRTILAP